MIDTTGQREGMTSLTFVEAINFAKSGALPENFKERVETAIALMREGVYSCSNCGDRLCMSCVCRELHDACVDDCPFCCVDGKRATYTPDEFPPDCEDGQCRKCHSCYSIYVELKMAGELD